jgi:uncharacterized protein YbjQ (UPF0145 family)
MTDKKKDLTRIEDLGEFFHQESEENFPDFTLDESSSSSESAEETTTDFGGLEFGTTEEFPAPEENKSEPAFTLPDELGPAEETKEITQPEVPLFGEDEPIGNLVEETFSTSNETLTSRSLSFEAPVMDEPAPIYTPESVYKSPETFEEVKRFAEESSFSGMGAEGNPSFSVLVRKVKYVEDVNDIIIMMKELQLLSDSEEETRKRLSKGHLLVPRISEYAAILLTHKLRRFDIDIQMGLSDEIHPPKHHEAPEAGLTSKHTLHQNQSHHFHFDHPKLEISQVIVSATPTLQGYQVVRYLGVASEHKTVEAELVEDESNAEVPRYYQELAQKLRAHAVKAHSNAIVGLNYQLTPIPSEYGGAGHKYRLSCTGNLVWVNKL